MGNLLPVAGRRARRFLPVVTLTSLAYRRAGDPGLSGSPLAGASCRQHRLQLTASELGLGVDVLGQRFLGGTGDRGGAPPAQAQRLA